MVSKIKKFFPIFLVFLFLSGCRLSSAYDEPLIRIALIKDSEYAILAIRGSYEIIDPRTNTVLLKDRVLRKSKIKALNNGIYVGRKFYRLNHLRLSPGKNFLIFLKGKYLKYRGFADIIVMPKGGISVVNILPLEKYVKGVLYHEVSHRWPMEAMKAQAVAVRTYALFQAKENIKNYYDVTGDIYSQVYGGRGAERFRTNIAVDRTKGEVLLYKGKILPAYFHSNCGGHTEDVTELWKQDLLPLKGVVCHYCKNEPGYHWKRNFQLSKIQRSLNDNGFNIGPIKDIKVLSRNNSGRIKKLKIVSRDSSSIEIEGKDFRSFIGPNEIRSNNYDIIMKGYYADFVGRGWGHGVGMCQWGAFGMAKRRFKYEEILMFYYPGSTMKNLKIINNNY